MLSFNPLNQISRQNDNYQTANIVNSFKFSVFIQIFVAQHPAKSKKTANPPYRGKK